MQDRNRGGGPPLYPKPFNYLDLPSISPRRARPVTHEQRKVGLINGQLEGRIRTLGPIHVGSGNLELSRRLTSLSRKDQEKYPLVRGFVSSNGNLVIPGSSLKGAIRSAVEAITLSCVAKKGSRTNVDRELQECRNKEYLCPTCRIFGAMGFLGKVKFGDAVQEEGGKIEVWELPQMFRPQTNDPDGRKFYMHGKQAKGEQPVQVVPENQFFSFKLRFDNLEPTEIGVLVLAMGLSPRPGESLRLKLGGFKPACLGSVEFEPERLMIEQAEQNALNYDAPEDALFTDATEISKQFEQWVKQAREKLVQAEQFEQLVETLQYPGNRDCPPGMY